MRNRKIVRLYIGEFNTTGKSILADADVPRAMDGIIRTVSERTGGATVYNAVGAWDGITEESTVIETVCSPEAIEDLFDIAGKVADVFGQHSVMVTVADVQATFVSASGLRTD